MATKPIFCLLGAESSETLQNASPANRVASHRSNAPYGPASRAVNSFHTRLQRRNSFPPCIYVNERVVSHVLSREIRSAHAHASITVRRRETRLPFRVHDTSRRCPNGYGKKRLHLRAASAPTLHLPSRALIADSAHRGINEMIRIPARSTRDTGTRRLADRRTRSRSLTFYRAIRDPWCV